MDYILYFISALFILAGVIGSVIPVIPGPPLGFLSLLFLHFTDKVQFSTSFLVIAGVVAVAITVLDYFIPMWGTKKFGGSRAGKIGSILGVFVGLFFGPLGILLGPFAGAFLGELIHDKNDMNKAIKSATGSFIGFLFGTGLKLVVSGLFLYFYIKELF